MRGWLGDPWTGFSLGIGERTLRATWRGQAPMLEYHAEAWEEGQRLYMHAPFSRAWIGQYTRIAAASLKLIV